jgi:hypothetical protein
MKKIDDIEREVERLLLFNYPLSRIDPDVRRRPERLYDLLMIGRQIKYNQGRAHEKITDSRNSY